MNAPQTAAKFIGDNPGLFPANGPFSRLSQVESLAQLLLSAHNAGASQMRVDILHHMGVVLKDQLGEIVYTANIPLPEFKMETLPEGDKSE